MEGPGKFPPRSAVSKHIVKPVVYNSSCKKAELLSWFLVRISAWVYRKTEVGLDTSQTGGP